VNCHGRTPRPVRKSAKLESVCYDIRGPVLEEARRLEDEGHRVLKLNIGNPAPFGFETPEEIVQDVIRNLPASQGYCDSKGLFSARKAVMQYCQQIGIPGVDTEDVYIGNGVSELIVMAMQGLLDAGDEILLPAPDYPLWTASVTLSGGTPVHYHCDEQNGWQPDPDDIRARITPRTRGIVLINPNNPTGAVYGREVLEAVADIARAHDLVVFSDEIYDKILYDDAEHLPMGAIAPDLLTLTFNGLSKNYRAAGFRTGWLIVSGNKRNARDYIEGLDILANMRLCANVPTQHAVQTALGGHQSIRDLCAPDGLLTRQRDAAHALLSQLPGVSCVKPRGALYVFPRIDPARLRLRSDEQFVLDLLREQRILVVQGTAFNWPHPDHFRLVFLPRVEELTDAVQRIGQFLEHYAQP
jgi:alanine-synthesizing transaminase